MVREVGDADGIAALLRPRASPLHYVQLLPAIAVAEEREGARRIVRELARVREEMGFRLIGYVVMPEHVHLLMSEPPRGTPSTVLQKLKLRVSRKMRRRRKSAARGQMRLPFEERGESLRAFWQARFYDFNVYSERKRIEKLDYMHANPITRKLVSHPKDWPWSSWGFYSRTGKVLIPIDIEK